MLIILEPEVEYLVKPEQPRTGHMGLGNFVFEKAFIPCIELTEEVKAALKVAGIEYGEEG